MSFILYKRQHIIQEIHNSQQHYKQNNGGGPGVYNSVDVDNPYPHK